MPIFQRLLERANYHFASDRIQKVDPDVLVLRATPDQNSLADCASALGIVKTDAERNVVARCPVSIQVALIAIAHSAVTRSKSAPVPIAFVWKSGYDFELCVFESRPGPNSWAGISIILTTPYPE